MHDDGQSVDWLHSDWVLVARDAQVLEREPSTQGRDADSATQPGLAPWTDDFNNLLGVLR